jgi:peptidoglycan-associated lipoprotein
MTAHRPLLSARVLSARGHWLVALCAAIGVGCAGAKPPDARSSGTAANTPSMQAAPPPASAPATTPSTVSISDEIRSRCGIPDADAYFSFDSAHLTANDRSPLDLVATCFTSGPLAGHAVKLVGRADPRGSDEYNMTLGQSRADAVGIYLAGRGVASSKTSSTSRGAMDATGTSEPGWQHDRRVDVLLGN